MDQYAGKIVEAPVSLIDLFPTFVDVTGVAADHPLDGVSLLEVVEDDARKPVVVYNNVGKAVITKDWHGIYYQKFDFNTRTFAPFSGEHELYDRKDDPWALDNISS